MSMGGGGQSSVKFSKQARSLNFQSSSHLNSHSTFHPANSFCFNKDLQNGRSLTLSPKLARFIEPQSFALKAKNDDLRLNSSSGGAFTLIAEYVLSLGGVVFGAAFDERLNVVHRFIEKPEQLELLRRSKYVESFIGESYKQALQFLKAGRLVLFSGVQCQIHALNSFLRKPYENLISVEMICNSVPSAKVWDIYKESLELELGENLQEFNFRGKNFGWEQGIFAVKTKTKTKILPHFSDIFLMNFLNHTITRKSCANCYSKGFVSGADFTLGDFWGIRAWHADFVDDKGVSCVLAHTQKALDILNAVSKDCLLQKTRSSLVVAGNPALVYSNPLNPQRNLVLTEFFALYQQSKDAKKAVEFLKNCTNNPNKKGFWQHYYRVYKDDPIRRAISKTLKRLQKPFSNQRRKNEKNHRHHHIL